MAGPVILNPAALAILLKSPAGPVGTDLIRRCIRVQNQARLNASGRPGPRVQTGRLRASITYRILSGPEGIYGEVGTNVEYAAGLEYGNPPHLIRPRTKQALYWQGAEYPVAYVNHPGNPPYPFLRPAVFAAGG